MEGSNASDCKKNDGLGRIRTGDPPCEDGGFGVTSIVFTLSLSFSPFVHHQKGSFLLYQK
jgi:hypothetical protein